MVKETILIVDDNREIVAALSDVLKSKGYVTLAAYDGAKGLELALAQSPDLILLDWNLPELSGMQVLQALRDQGYQAPVILMTVYGSEGIAVQAFKLGIRDYIRKPVRMAETLESVEKALAEDRLRREKERISKELAEANRRLEQQLLEITTLHAIARSITAVLDLRTGLGSCRRGGLLLQHCPGKRHLSSGPRRATRWPSKPITARTAAEAPIFT